MPEWIGDADLSTWISGAGSAASVVALCLAVWEWRRVKSVRQEVEEQRDYFSKLHFLADDLRQLRDHSIKLDNHRKRKQWEQVERRMRRCLGNLEAMRPRLDESTSDSHRSLVVAIHAVLKRMERTQDDKLTLTTPVFKVIGDLDEFMVLVDNVLREYPWRQKP